MAVLALTGCSDDGDSNSSPTASGTEPSTDVTGSTVVATEPSPAATGAAAPVTEQPPETELSPTSVAEPVDLPPLPSYLGPRLRPVEAVLLTDGDGISFDYDVSPDGRWTARFDGSQLCLFPVDAAAEPACDGGQLRPSDIVRWAPDSTHVVVSYDLFRHAESGPIGLLGIDGTVTVLVEGVEVSADASPSDTPFAASSLDASTVVYGRLEDPADGPTFWTVGVGGGDDEIAGTIPPPGDEDVWIPFPDWLVSGNSIIASMTADGPISGGVWRFDLTNSSSELIREQPAVDESGFDFILQPIDVGGDRVLLGSSAKISTFSRAKPGRDAYEIVDMPSGRVIPIPERWDDRVHRFAALSPDGDFVAVLSQYVGSDSVTRETSFYNVAITTVTSLATGEPEWFDLSSFDVFPVSRDLGVQYTPLVWDEDDLLLAEMESGLYRITLEPVE
jgi:hypothetical protein